MKKKYEGKYLSRSFSLLSSFFPIPTLFSDWERKQHVSRLSLVREGAMPRSLASRIALRTLLLLFLFASRGAQLATAQEPMSTSAMAMPSTSTSSSSSQQKLPVPRAPPPPPSPPSPTKIGKAGSAPDARKRRNDAYLPQNGSFDYYKMQVRLSFSSSFFIFFFLSLTFVRRRPRTTPTKKKSSSSCF